MENPYAACNLCGHRCGVNRAAGKTGVCGMTDEVYVSRAALHFWEEPIISGTGGSGTVFFSGCSLGCVYCQNREISRGVSGKPVSVSRLVDVFFELREKGAHNINLVTPTHFVPTIREAVAAAKARGLGLPFVYNSGGYDTVETLKTLDGLIDVYLPDRKYHLSRTAAEYSRAADYPSVSLAAITEMVRQTGAPRFDPSGMLTRGTVVRVLLLPTHVAEAKLTVGTLYRRFGDNIYLSLMNQYTPMPGMRPPLDRPVTRAEYRELVDYAVKLGVRNAFTQDEGTVAESFIPPFDLTGV